eukprot:scaffold8178_cov296-Pinguiococcus_pyrenoidosus.AAC.8
MSSASQRISCRCLLWACCVAALSRWVSTVASKVLRFERFAFARVSLARSSEERRRARRCCDRVASFCMLDASFCCMRRCRRKGVSCRRMASRSPSSRRPIDKAKFPRRCSSNPVASTTQRSSGSTCSR